MNLFENIKALWEFGQERKNIRSIERLPSRLTLVFILTFLVKNYDLIIIVLTSDGHSAKKEISDAIEDSPFFCRVLVSVGYAFISLLLFYFFEAIALLMKVSFEKVVKPFVFSFDKSRIAEKKELDLALNRNRELQQRIEKIQKESSNNKSEISRLDGVISELEELNNGLMADSNHFGQIEEEILMIKKENTELRQMFASYKFDTPLCISEQTTIKQNPPFKISSDFINYPKGAFSVWVKLDHLDDLLKKPANDKYILSHDTNKGNPIQGGEINQYLNGFGLCLAPEHLETSGSLPQDFRWKLWFSNEKTESKIFISEILGVRDMGWHHLFFRWIKEERKFEFYYDGKLISTASDFQKYWPQKIGESNLGNWTNLDYSHNLNLPLYRVIISSDFLPDPWLNDEQKKRPIS